jgi:hypothetical protein
MIEKFRGLRQVEIILMELFESAIFCISTQKRHDWLNLQLKVFQSIHPFQSKSKHNNSFLNQAKRRCKTPVGRTDKNLQKVIQSKIQSRKVNDE